MQWRKLNVARRSFGHGGMVSRLWPQLWSRSRARDGVEGLPAEGTAGAKASRPSVPPPVATVDGAEGSRGGCQGRDRSQTPWAVGEASCEGETGGELAGKHVGRRLEIEPAACRKRDFEPNGKHPSRLSWALSLESIFSAPAQQQQKATLGTERVFILVSTKLLTGPCL